MMHLKEPQPPDPLGLFGELSSHAHGSFLNFLRISPNCCIVGLQFVDVALTGPSSSPVTTVAHPSIEVVVSSISVSPPASLLSIVGPQGNQWVLSWPSSCSCLWALHYVRFLYGCGAIKA
uniref:Uncharacterized protein n=1 Tax=Opuntia streptacantha TaxID=393608 RepID=A0A7C8ZJE1_OPUST